MRKRVFLPLAIIMVAFGAYAQVGVSYHTSDLSFAGVNYTYKSAVTGEFRISTDIDADDAYYEFVGVYNLSRKKEEYDAYIGLGGNTLGDGSLVVPLGLNVYPFEQKAFGFHSEISYLSGEEIIRGSIGIRYRFIH